jgi:DNA-binding MarR family transcriptional regulator
MTNHNPHNEPRLVANVGSLELFRERLGVWLSFTGNAYYKAYARALGEKGLKPSWVTAMAIIQQEASITQSGLGRFMAVNRASAMAMAIEMEDAGLVTRTLQTGRNKTALSLTSKGESALAEGCRTEEALSAAVTASLGTEALETLVDTLKTIEIALQQTVSQNGPPVKSMRVENPFR